MNAPLIVPGGQMVSFCNCKMQSYSWTPERSDNAPWIQPKSGRSPGSLENSFVLSAKRKSINEKYVKFVLFSKLTMIISPYLVFDI